MKDVAIIAAIAALATVALLMVVMVAGFSWHVGAGLAALTFS